MVLKEDEKELVKEIFSLAKSNSSSVLARSREGLGFDEFVDALKNIAEHFGLYKDGGDEDFREKFLQADTNSSACVDEEEFVSYVAALLNATAVRPQARLQRLHSTVEAMLKSKQDPFFN